MSNSVCDSEKKCDLCETENENLEDSQETLHLSVLEEICDQSIEFEDALTKVTFGKFNYCLIFMCGVNMAAVMLEILGISFVNPLAQCDLELTNWDKGVLSAIVLLGIILSSHLWGFLADTMGRRAVMMPTLFAAFFSTLLSSFSSNFWVIAVLRFLTGLFISGSSSTVYAYLGEFHNTKNRTRVIMAASTIFGLFCILMPVLAWAILSTTWTLNFSMIGITYKPWRFFLVVCGLPDLFCAISFFWLPESPKFILAQGHQTDTVNIIRQIYSINTGKSRETLKICAIVHEDESLSSRKTNEENYGLRLLRSIYDQTTPIFMGNHLKKTIILCTLQLWMFFTANGMYMFLPDILNRVALHRSRSGDNYTATICQAITETTIDIKDIVMEDNTSCELRLDSTAFNHTLAVEVLYFFGFILIGIMISKVGKLTILIFVFMGSGICGIAIVFTTLPTLSTYLYVILLLCGLTMNVINGVTIDLFPTHLRAMSVSISLMVGRLGSVFGSNLVATILEYNCEATFLISGISLMLCGILTIFIPNIHARPNKRLPKNNLSISSGELQ